MEIVDAGIQKLLAKPYSLILRAGRQEMTTRVEVISDVLRDRQPSQMSGMIEYGHRSTGILELVRSWFVKYNKPVYYQPKEFHEIIRKARSILIPRKQKPSFIEDLKEFLKRIQATEPNIIKPAIP